MIICPLKSEVATEWEAVYSTVNHCKTSVMHIAEIDIKNSISVIVVSYTQ
jgi:hypothetical protein